MHRSEAQNRSEASGYEVTSITRARLSSAFRRRVFACPRAKITNPSPKRWASVARSSSLGMEVRSSRQVGAYSSAC